jgi:hypothetical protein
MVQKDRRLKATPSGETWFVYLLRCADGSLYTGITKDLPAVLTTGSRRSGSSRASTNCGPKSSRSSFTRVSAEVVVGDLLEPADVYRVVGGCRRVYFGMSVSAAYLEATVTMAAVAREVGVDVLVNMSQMTVAYSGEGPLNATMFLLPASFVPGTLSRICLVVEQRPDPSRRPRPTSTLWKTRSEHPNDPAPPVPVLVRLARGTPCASKIDTARAPVESSRAERGVDKTACQEGKRITAIAALVGLTRQTCYSALKKAE